MKIITPAIAKSTSAIAISTMMSSVLFFPPLSEVPELVLSAVPELVAVAVVVVVVAGVAVAVAVGDFVAVGFTVGGDVIGAAVMVRCCTPVV